MRKFVAIALLIGLAGTTLASEDDVEYRQDIMSAIGNTLGSIGKIMKQEVDRPADLPKLVAALDELAQTASSLFQEGSEGGDAMAEVWEQPEEFAQKVEAFKTATAAFREVASSGDPMQIGGALQQVGRSCKGCHDSFRK